MVISPPPPEIWSSKKAGKSDSVAGIRFSSPIHFSSSALRTTTTTTTRSSSKKYDVGKQQL
eukprot:scaffold3436_cov66-Cylindrotheca_fusiformis.AAC.5